MDRQFRDEWEQLARAADAALGEREERSGVLVIEAWRASAHPGWGVPQHFALLVNGKGSEEALAR